MDTLKIIMSKAQSIRFANNNGLLPSFDNTLSINEVFAGKPVINFEQTYFQNDEVLFQVKAGLTATVVFKQHFESGTITTITVDTVTTYSDFKIYEYLVTFAALGRSYFNATSEESNHLSECVNVTATDTEHLLIQWSNNDALNNTFEFDYTTTLAEANVNYIRLKGWLLEYQPKGEAVIYDNQNEKVKLKSSLFRQLSLQTQMIPRQMAEVIIIAMQHDLFLINEVGYVVEDLPGVNQFGIFVELNADITSIDSLGFNTDDIGFVCDEDCEVMVENYKQEDAAGSGSFAITDGFGVTQIIAKKISGSPILKVGTTVGGDEIYMERAVSNIVPPKIVNTRYTPDISGAWNCYYTVTGGIIDIFIQTIRFLPV